MNQVPDEILEVRLVQLSGEEGTPAEALGIEVVHKAKYRIRSYFEAGVIQGECRCRCALEAVPKGRSSKLALARDRSNRSDKPFKQDSDNYFPNSPKFVTLEKNGKGHVRFVSSQNYRLKETTVQ